MTDDIKIDRDYSITRHAAVQAGPDAFVAAMRSAAGRAYEAAIKAARTPVMVEVVVRVAPQERVS